MWERGRKGPPQCVYASTDTDDRQTSVRRLSAVCPRTADGELRWRRAGGTLETPASLALAWTSSTLAVYTVALWLLRRAGRPDAVRQTTALPPSGVNGN